MKKKLLITQNIPICNYKNWQDVFELDMPEISYSRSEYLERAQQAHYIIACQQTVDRELLNIAHNLQAVNSYGVGFDNIDVAACQERGVLATNTPNSVTESTAELAMGLLLALCRRIPEIDAGMRAEIVEFGVMKNPGTTLYGKTLGIIGLGRIGKALARRATAMGMKVYYHNRNKLSQAEEEKHQVTYLPLEDLFTKMDVVSLNMPLSKSSYHLVNQNVLRLMKKSAFLINTARGKVVDEEALVNALEDQQIAGAALDVFEHEPHVHPGLLKSHKTVLMPHAGTDTLEVCQKMFCEGIEGFLEVDRGSSPSNLIK
ncbi:NAD(P)-binding domain-containing protein [Clostridia bacterium]|nr:NAD(P)-binding domain-containing protein [Clostridia bacterium]